MSNPNQQTTDVPAGLTFVDPNETPPPFRFVLWAAPGEGKTVGAASAPDPILVVSADRPRAWQYARSKYPSKAIHEARFQGPQTLADVYTYLKANHEEMRGGTVVLDPWQTIYNTVRDALPLRGGEVDYEAVNKKMVGFLHSLRQFDVHVVIVAHERLNDGKRGDNKLYPQLGGPSLINEILKESDVVGRVEREPGGIAEDGTTIPDRYVAQLMPRDNLVVKETLGLGDRREIDLTAWIEEARARERRPVEDLAPWDEGYVAPEDAQKPDEDVPPPEPAAAPETTPETPETTTSEFDPATGKLRAVPDAPTEEAPDPEQQTLGENVTAEDLLQEIRDAGVKANEFRGIVKSVGLEPPTQLTAKDHYTVFLDGIGGARRDAILLALGRRAKVMAGAAS